MDVAIAHQWLERLSSAWRDRDPEAVGDLFTSGAIYHSHPFQAPLRGRAEITQYWASATSSPAEIEVTFGNPLVDGDRMAVEWWSVIDEGGRPTTDAGGLFLTFVDGRCSTLREYWNLTDDVRSAPEGWGR
jgi:hypothetical protein